MKTTLTEIIETLESVNEDCKCDLRSEWPEDLAKHELTTDLAILRQAICLLKDLRVNGKELFFNNISQ